MIIRGPGADGRTGCGATGGRGAVVCADAEGAAELATGCAAAVGAVTEGAGAEGPLATGAAGLGATGGVITLGGAIGAVVAGAVVGLATGVAAEGLASCGGDVTGRAGAAVPPCCLPMMAFSTSPGLEI
jgi:hypothetical protein